MSLDSTENVEAKLGFTVSNYGKNKPLSECVQNALESYFKHLNGHAATGIHAMVIEEVERPLFQGIMEYTRGNQSKAAGLLGISRSTLRKKLAFYGVE